jgi:hypothetical protein
MVRANREDRTLDLTITNRLLYQLSYVGATKIIPVSPQEGKDFFTV